MAGTLSLTVGTTTSTVPISATNANINAAILRYCRAKALNIEGLNAVQVGEVFLAHLVRSVRDISIDQHRIEEHAVHNTTIETKIQTENSF